MVICMNEKTPDRNDNYGKDGYAACCPKPSCRTLIGKKQYFKTIVPGSASSQQGRALS